MRFIFAALLTVSLIPVAGVISASDASAQATCRQKCNDTEQACLKRTGNKSQCGGRAKTCLAKCK
jgi:hypothetical protein